MADDDACDPLDELGGHNLEGTAKGLLFLVGYLPATLPDAFVDIVVVAGVGHWGIWISQRAGFGFHSFAQDRATLSSEADKDFSRVSKCDDSSV